MKRIIKGRMYNTETAIDCGAWFDDTMSHLCCLMRKKNGEYFINDDTGRISPISVDEAKQFAEDFLTVDEYIKEFGPVEE